MKKFFAILIVALLATSFAYSQGSAFGTITVSVTYPPIVVTSYDGTGTQTESMEPGQLKGMGLSAYNFKFQAVGAYGIPQTNVTGVWSHKITTAGTFGVYAVNHTDSNLDPALPWALYNDTGAPI